MATAWCVRSAGVDAYSVAREQLILAQQTGQRDSCKSRHGLAKKVSSLQQMVSDR